MKLNVISAHVSAFIATAVSVFTVVHPGFHVPTSVQVVLPSVCVIIAGVIEGYHLITHRQLQLHTAIALASQVAQQAEAAKPSATKSWRVKSFFVT